MDLSGRLRRIRGGDFRRGVLTLVAGTGTAQLIVVASAPILTRLYPPEAYGTFAVATSIIAILISVTCLRYEFAIPLPESDATAANVLALAIVTDAAMTLVAGIGLFLVGPTLFAAMGLSVLAPYLVLMSIGQFGGGLVAALTAWAVRVKAFSTIAATRLTQAGSMVAVQIVLGYLGFGAGGLLTGDVAGRISGSTRLARGAWHTHAAELRRVSRSEIAAAARRYRRFPLLSSPSALLNVIGVQAPVLLFVGIYGAGAGGAFALADRICSIPLSLVSGAVGQVFLADAARLAGERLAVRSLFVRTTRTLLLVGVGPAVLLMVLAPVLAGPVLGQDWELAGAFVAILTPMYLAAFVATATGDALYVVERQDLQLVREVLRLVLLGGAVPLAATVGLTTVGAAALLSVAGCLNYVLYGLISYRAIVVHERRASLGAAT
jgi:O-antigen/teichoic acid export membrane protein